MVPFRYSYAYRQLNTDGGFKIKDAVLSTSPNYYPDITMEPETTSYKEHPTQEAEKLPDIHLTKDANGYKGDPSHYIGLIGDHQYQSSYNFLGRMQYDGIDNSYKYLVMTFTGDLSTLRLEDNYSDNIGTVYWFNPGAGTEFGKEGSDVPMKLSMVKMFL
jgi:hypothetical protein